MAAICTLALALLVAGCDDASKPVAPELTHVLRTPSSPSLSRSGDVLGTFYLSVPPNNDSNSGTVGWRDTGIDIHSSPETGYMRVRVSGQVTATPNPQFIADFCSNPEIPDYQEPTGCQNNFFGLGNVSAGPRGWTTDRQLAVSARIRKPDGTTELFYLALTGTDSSEVVGLPSSDGVLEVERSGSTSSWFSWNFPDRRTVRDFSLFFSGGQNVSVELVGPLRSIARQTVVATGDTAWFDADSNGGTTTGLWWQYVRYDTLATPKGTNSATWISACGREPTCGFVPPASGRLYVAASVDGVNFPAMPSQVVWVGKKKLEMACTPHSTISGQGVTCTATTNPSGGTVEGPVWSYTGGYPGPPGSGSSWTFQPTSSGTVTVSATVDGVLQVASDSVTVDCNMFGGLTGDSVVDNAAVQDALSTLWFNSDPHDSDLFARREQAGWVVLHADGSLSMEPFASNTSPAACSADIDVAQVNSINNRANGDTVIAGLHTHPQTPPKHTNVTATRDCTRFKAGDVVTFRPGLSPADSTAASVLGMPIYALDHRNLLRALPNGAKKAFPRDLNCHYR